MTDEEDDDEPSELKVYRICSSCIGEEYLEGEVDRDGEAGNCSYCGKDGKTISVGELADRVDAAMEEHYYRTSIEPEGLDYLAAKEGNWERDGEPVTWVIADAAMIGEKPAEHVRQILEEKHDDFDEAAAGEENPFDEEAQYAESSVRDDELKAEWTYFQETLRTESRFFNRSAEGALAAIFGDLAGHSTRDGKPAIVDAGPGREVAALYRARVFQSREKLKEALTRPDLGVGPPPPRLASAGRMNARGIAVFYGATDAAVALAETRPPVGSQAVVARFEIVRPLRLLDIEALRSIYVDGSIFDRSYIRRLEKAKFLRTVSRTISEPVMPDDEPYEYLVTQAIADYLATQNEPALDGIIYPSVQNAGQLKNVVLFHKAARVGELDLPKGTEISVQLDAYDEDQRYPDYRVFETTPAPPPEEALNDDDLWAVVVPGVARQSQADTRTVTLRVDIKSVTVHHVGSVTYATDSRPVQRYRSERREPKV